MHAPHPFPTVDHHHSSPLELAYQDTLLLLSSPGAAQTPERCSRLWEFLQLHLLSHVRVESPDLARAVAAGAPLDLVELLRIEHEALAVIARRLIDHGLSPARQFIAPHMALATMRLLRSFEQHLAYEHHQLEPYLMSCQSWPRACFMHEA